MKIYNRWKKEMELRLAASGLKENPSMMKRCPSCGELGLKINIKTGKIHCNKCGFEENLPVMKK